ncbi:MAG: amidohydrolase family protein [Gemmatimonadota bacterium]|nr:amidohydrolase family protein [Gemmatimonadota bacterium]
MAISAPHPAPAQGRADPAPIVLTHVTVIDVASGRSRPDQTLIVIGNRIARLGPSGTTPVANGARVIDAHRKFVIPGLWDMHVHLFRHSANAPADVHERYFPLFLANGVTGVRDMWTSLEDFRTLRNWRRGEAAGTLLGPRIAGSSTIVDGVPTIWPNSIGVTTAAEARRVVDSLVRGGAEFVKVYTGLSRDAYFAIADRSKSLGIPFAGHLPLSIGAAEASDAGQKSIEHLSFAEDCSTARDQLVQLHIDSTLARPEGGLPQLFLNTYSDSLCAALFRRFVRNGTWQVPTLVVLRQLNLAFDSTLMLDPYLRYVTNEERTAWTARKRAIAQRTTAREAEIRRRRFQKSLDIVAAMQRAGVPTLAGSDVGNPWLVPGYSLHDELALFVQAGMPPLAALQTATINPARYLGALDSLGTIAEGKIADLVLLDGNPLNDIRNTRRIRAVIANGRLLTRPALDSLLGTVQVTPLSADHSPVVEQAFSCLPSNVKPADVVWAELSRGAPPKLITVTVEDTLKQLRARCARGTLVDPDGKEVRFYPVHCFGSPTPYAIETLRRERADLEALRKRYRVIEMSAIPQPCA